MTIAIKNASNNSVGVVKIGAGLSISEDGTLSIGGKNMYDMLITKLNFDARPMLRNRIYHIFPIADAPAVTPTYYSRTNEIITLSGDIVRIALRPGKSYKLDETLMVIARLDYNVAMEAQEFIGFTPQIIPYVPSDNNVINTSPYSAGKTYGLPKAGIIRGLNGNTLDITDEQFTYSHAYSAILYNNSRTVQYLTIQPGFSVTADSQETIDKYSHNIGGYYSLVITPLEGGTFTTS